MQNRVPGTDVGVSVQLLNEAGQPIVPTALRWRVLNELDAELQGWTNIAGPFTTSVATVTVQASLNQLPTGVHRGIRRVEIEATSPQSVIIVSELYLLQGSTGLTFGVNTFLTYSEAVLLAMDFSSNTLTDWLSAMTKDEQEQVLIEAHARIIRLPLRMEYESDQSRIITAPWGRYRFEDMTPEQVSQLEPRMIRALKRAQLLEANHLLGDKDVNQARRQGLMSMTTGESSQFFRPSKPLELGVCKEAYRELARWMDRQVRLGRG